MLVRTEVVEQPGGPTDSVLIPEGDIYLEAVVTSMKQEIAISLTAQTVQTVVGS